MRYNTRRINSRLLYDEMTTEQIEKLKKLISTAKNEKQKASYKALLKKLVAQSSPPTPKNPKPPRDQLIATKPLPTPLPENTVPSKSESPPEPVVQKPESEKPQSSDDKLDTSSLSPEPKKKTAIFQALGIITGEVKFSKKGASININSTNYRLLYAPQKKREFEALKLEIKNSESSFKRLAVYPIITHFHHQDKPHQVSFQVVGFEGKNRPKIPLKKYLKDFEFYLSGLWKVIPLCRIPCISIFRNLTPNRLNWVKNKEKKGAPPVKFLQASHIPLIWKDSPVPPFHFNPTLEKEQQEPTYFVQIKAQFFPGHDVFRFVEQLAEPTLEVPPFLKPSKKLKAEALKEMDEHKQQKQSLVQETAESEPQQSAIRSQRNGA